MINGLDLKEILEKCSYEELKNMEIRVENVSFDNVMLDLKDSFECNNIAISDYNKTLILEF